MTAMLEKRRIDHLLTARAEETYSFPPSLFQATFNFLVLVDWYHSNIDTFVHCMPLSLTVTFYDFILATMETNLTFHVLFYNMYGF